MTLARNEMSVTLYYTILLMGTSDQVLLNDMHSKLYTHIIIIMQCTI